MTSNYHTPWIDSVTQYKASHMNAPLSQLDTAIGTISGEYPLHHSGERHYDIGVTFDGKPDASAVLLRYPFPRVVDFDTIFSGSQAVVGTAPTGAAQFSIQKNAVEVGTLDFGAGGSTGSFSGSAQTFQAGDVITLVAPSSQDATLEDLGLALKGYYF